MRGRVVPFGMAALVLVVTPGGSGSARPLHLVAPQREAARSVALVWQKNGAGRLAALNPRTLRAGKRRIALGFVDAWAFDHPGGGVLAVASTPVGTPTFPQPSDAIRFVDVRRLRVLPGSVPLGGGVYARALLWTQPDRLVALLETCCEGYSSFVAIDPAARRVVATTPLWGDTIGIGRVGDALVLLETSHGQVGPARLVVVSDTGSVRSVQLDRVSAGYTAGDDAQGSPGTQRIPALVVDPSGYRAYVIQPDGPAAEIDLRTLTVAYHNLTAHRSLLARLSAWLTPSVQAKGWTGPQRNGVWLGNGLIAVTGGDDSQVIRADGGVQFNTSAAGLAIIDTRDWTVQMLDPRVDTVMVSDGLLLATEISSNEKHGIGLEAYGSDRKLKFSLFSPWAVSVEAALDGRAYVNTYNAYGVYGIAVVNLATGRVVGKRHDQLPTPVLVDGPDY